MANTRNTKEVEEGPRSFIHQFSEMSDGDFAHDASIELNRVLTALRDEAIRVHGKIKGGLTIKLRFTVEDGGGVAQATCDIKPDIPRPRRAPAHMFITKGGNLSLTNPRQLDLPAVREVKGEDRNDVNELEGRRGAPREL